MESIDLSKIISGPVDIWAILFILIVIAKKAIPLLKEIPKYLKERIQIEQSHIEISRSTLECLQRIEKNGNDMKQKMENLPTKEDVYNIREHVLIDKLNGASKKLDKSAHG